MKNKVYCKNCRYYSTFINTESLREKCQYKDNFKEIDTYYDRELVLISIPREINQNNDCKWYEYEKSK